MVLEAEARSDASAFRRNEARDRYAARYVEAICAAAQHGAAAIQAIISWAAPAIRHVAGHVPSSVTWFSTVKVVATSVGGSTNVGNLRCSGPPGGGPFSFFAANFYPIAREGFAAGLADEQFFARQNFPCPQSACHSRT